MKIKSNNKYKCKINIRPFYKRNGKSLIIKENVKILDGLTVDLLAYFIMDNEDKYPGEVCLAPFKNKEIELFDKAGISWIASGDVKAIKEIMKIE